MKTFSSLLIVLFVLKLCSCEREYYFNQNIDHFSLSRETFKQRYFVFDEFKKPEKDIILLYICGEMMCPGTPTNYARDYAKHLGASIVTVEHRYYGKSVPTPSLSTSNLRFLTTQQALADLANFITQYSKNYNNPKWITIGCSYPGALSAWFRLKYPHLAVGALSSSGVVNAVLDFWQFDDQVRVSAGVDCSDQLRRVTSIIENKLKADAYQVKSLFNAQNLSNADFMYLMADSAAESIQYGFHNKVCDPMSGGSSLSDDQLLQHYVKFVTEFFYKEFDTDAPNDYDIKFIMDETVVPQNSWRQWWYQTCAEVGYLQTYNSSRSIRSSMIDLKYHYDRCQKVFGIKNPPNTEFTNIYYGGDRVDATNIVHANGSQDPWKRASVRKSQSDSSPLIEIECLNCGHCVDLRGCPSLPSGKPSRKCTDNKAVDRAREEILKRMRSWLE